MTDKLIEEQAAEIARLRAEVAGLKGRLEQGVTLTCTMEGGGRGPDGPFCSIPVTRTVTVPSVALSDRGLAPGWHPGLPSTTGPAGVPGGCGGRGARNTTSDGLKPRHPEPVHHLPGLGHLPAPGGAAMPALAPQPPEVPVHDQAQREPAQAGPAPLPADRAEHAIFTRDETTELHGQFILAFPIDHSRYPLA